MVSRKGPLCNEKPCSVKGRAVSQLEFPFLEGQLNSSFDIVVQSRSQVIDSRLGGRSILSVNTLLEA